MGIGRAGAPGADQAMCLVDADVVFVAEQIDRLWRPWIGAPEHFGLSCLVPTCGGVAPR